MKNVLANIGATLALIAIGLGLVTVLKSSHNETSQKTPTVVSQQAKAIQAEVAKGSLLLDVRTAEEFNARHAKDATLWPVQDIQAGKLPEVAKDKKIYVYCHSGNRSSQAKALLEQAGFTNVVDLGGLTSLEKMGLSMVGNSKTL